MEDVDQLASCGLLVVRTEMPAVQRREQKQSCQTPRHDIIYELLDLFRRSHDTLALTCIQNEPLLQLQPVIG